MIGNSAELIARLRENMGRVVLGKPEVVRLAVVALLAESKERASEPVENGVSTVIYALYVREPDIARLLAAAKSRLDVFEAAALGDATALAAILAADPLAAVDWSPDGFTALHLAAFLGAL